MTHCHMGHIEGKCAGEEIYGWPCPERNSEMIEPHDFIASKMIGYRGKLGIPDTTPCVFGSGPIPPKAVILGGNPDGASVSAQFPFMRVAGQLLAGMMTSAGLAFGDFYRTYAIKFQPFSTADRTAASLREAAWPFLKKELKVIGRVPEIDDQGAVYVARPACRLMMVMGMTPALMLFGPDAMKMTSGLIRPALVGKQEWRCLITTDIADAVGSGAVKAAMREDFVTLAKMVNGSAR
jgi:uracil-DNA glycosylase family 4